MSDHDRGAYTPQTDAPLSFDARQARGRKAFPTTLVISLVILLGLGGAIFMFYRSGVRGAGEAPVPVGSPVGEIKAPVPASAQDAQKSADAAAGLQIYKSEGAPATAPPSAPVFTAGPEQPAPRPAPTSPVAVAAAPVHAVPVAAATTPSAVAASGATTKAAPAPVAAPAVAPVKSVSVATTKPAPGAAPGDAVGDLLKSKATPAPKPVQLAEAKPTPQPVSSAAHGAAVVQIGAFSSAALASKGWSDIAAAYPTDMAGKGKLVETVDRDGKTLWRGAVSGFASHADAVAFCSKIKADGKNCIVR
jgi:cytoskeletal protein RodZ